MDVTKTPPPGAVPTRAGTASSADAGSRPAAHLASLTDRADIRALSIPAALQILLAEVRSALELTALAMDSAGTGSRMGCGSGVDTNDIADSPSQAARAVLQVFLQAMPEDAASLPSWAAALAQAETALQAGLDRGIAAISAWQDVPAMVVDAAKGARALIFTALSAESQNPLWTWPEWAALAPRLERFWRRRRLARRQLTDPDQPERSFDDNNERRS